MTTPLERYALAASEARGRRVLDVGGNDAGRRLLADQARALHTTDLDHLTAGAVPVEGEQASIDVVTWLDPDETACHFSGAAEAILRVLGPEGRLVVAVAEPEVVTKRFEHARVLLEAPEQPWSLMVASRLPLEGGGPRAGGTPARAWEGEVGGQLALAALRDAEGEAAHWRELYLDVESSSAMRMVQRFRRVVERTAPAGSRRRQAYQRVTSGIERTTGLSNRRTDGRGPEVLPAGTAQAARRLVLPRPVGRPEVSVVIPVHGKWALTADCLRSIVAARSTVSFETVVVDDASPDDTAERLAEVVGAKVVTLQANLGFLGAANAGMEAAEGRFVVLLNNDTLVERGWLEALAETARGAEDIGVVGAKLVYPDGTLQEAGGIIWSDASGANYGRGEDPHDPRFSFLRDVDYCSGACLLVRREVLEATGGFDTRFSPAYYEDTDLCFAARRLGYRVVYQPDAVVRHLEGASHGTDITSGVKRHQAINRSKFALKWREELAQQAPPETGHTRLASWRAPAGRVLVAEFMVPRPDEDSGSRRMVELLKLLTRAGFGVTFVPQDASRTKPPYDHDLRAAGIEVLEGPVDLHSYLVSVAPQLRLAVLSRPVVAWANFMLLRTLAPETTLVYDTVDLHFLREERRAAIEETAEARRSARYHRDVELSLATVFDATWVVSPVEAETLRHEVPGAKVFVVPNIHEDQEPGPSFEERQGLLFVGSYPHHPNVDAAIRLAQVLLPKIHERLPDVPLYVVGSHPPQELRSLASDQVHVLGWVRDLNHLYRRCRLFAAPLRFGAGMKGKIGESMAYGLPVVTTPLGAEGMGLTDGANVLVGHSDEDLVDHIVAAYTDRALWERIAEEGRRFIAEEYSPAAVAHRLDEVLAGLGLKKAG